MTRYTLFTGLSSNSIRDYRYNNTVALLLCHVMAFTYIIRSNIHQMQHINTTTRE